MFYLQSSPGISPCKPISHLSFQSVKVVWPKHLGFPNKSLPLLKFALNGTWRCTIPGFQSLVTRDFLFLGRWPPPSSWNCCCNAGLVEASYVHFLHSGEWCSMFKKSLDMMPFPSWLVGTQIIGISKFMTLDLLTVSMLVVWGTRVKIYETSFALKVEDHSVPQLNPNTAQPTQHDTPFHCTLTCCAIQLCGYTLKIQWQVGSTDIIVLQKWLVLFLQNPWTPKQIAFWAKSKMTTEVGLEASLRTGTIYQKKKVSGIGIQQENVSSHH